MSSSSRSAAVTIREVGPREGFQALPDIYPTDKKLELISLLVQSGIKHIEVTSMVRGERVPQMADAETLIAQLPVAPEVEFTALYLNTKGFARAEATARLANKGWLYTSPSNAFLKANANTSIEQSLASVADWGTCFKVAGKSVWGLMVSTAFGCDYEGPVAQRDVCHLVERFLQASSAIGSPIQEVCLADTVGRASPQSVGELVREVAQMGVQVSLHLHDTWGLGLTNAFAGLEAGVSIFETSIGGLGGCPFTPGSAGNVATEDVVFLCHSLGVATGLNINKLCEAAEFAEVLTGHELPGRVYKAHRNTCQRNP
jgi:hydroxymethylglutaryl-CoA lyase